MMMMIVAVNNRRSLHTTPLHPSLIRDSEQLTVRYDVRNLTGRDYVVCNGAPSASYLHLCTGWTRITVCADDEAALLRCLNDGRYEYVKRGTSPA